MTSASNDLIILAPRVNRQMASPFDKKALDICNARYFDKEGELALDWKRIWKHYLKTWFLLDLISSIPFEDLSSGDMIDLQADPYPVQVDV